MKMAISQEVFENLKIYMSEEEIKSNYDITISGSDPEAIEYIREYYNKHLPVNVTAWRQVNKFRNCDDSITEQIDFLAKEISGIFYITSSEANLKVIGTNLVMGKAIFPIFNMNFKEFELEITAAYTGNEWVVSFESNEEIESDVYELLSLFRCIREDSIKSQYLPKNKVYRPIDKGARNFTVIFKSQYDFYGFCVLLKDYLGY